MSDACFVSHGESCTRDIGAALGSVAQSGDVVLLCGDLGAGKTALTKGIAQGLGITESVTSPTFNILLVHEGRIPLYHMDLYRLENGNQLEDIDYYGTLEADGLTVVEWGNRFHEADPENRVLVTITITGDSTRSIQVDSRGERGVALAAAWKAAVGVLSLDTKDLT